MSETRPLSGQTQTRRRIWPEDVDLPVVSTDALRAGARVLIGEEYIDVGALASDPQGGALLAGCRRGVGREDGGCEPRMWPAGTTVAQMAELAAPIVATGREPTEADVGVIRHVDSGAGYWDAFNVVVHAPDRSLQTVALNLLQTGTDAAISYALKWGSYGTGNGQFRNPLCIAVASGGNVMVMDSGGFYDRAEIFSDSGTYLSKLDTFNGSDHFLRPYGIAISPISGDIYVVDSENTRILRFNAGWVYQGQWGTSGVGDGQFSSAYGIAVDAAGNVWVVDGGRDRLQRFGSTGTYQRKFGSAGSADGEFDTPSGVAIDAGGDLWIADRRNHRVQRFTDSGVWQQTIGGYGNGDGQFNEPYRLAFDPDGNLFVVDSRNHRIQKFAPDGSFLAKFGEYGTGPGQFNNPLDIAFTPAGDGFYVVDAYNSRIQKFRIGSDGQIQFLSDGASATDPDLFWDAAAKRLRAGIESGIAWLAGGVLRPATATQRTANQNIGNNANGDWTAACNVDEIVTGGGCYTGSNTGTSLVRSAPSGQGWRCIVRNTSGGTVTGTAYAVCLG